jgi:alginate O-acetyltransferase complex protein AlgJ
MSSAPLSQSKNTARPTPKGSWTSRIAMALFLAWLFFPLAYKGLHPASGQNASAAAGAVKQPILGGRPLSDFLRDAAIYYEKTSPLRAWLIRRHMAFRLNTLGMSSVSSVIIGRNHWLFLGRETDKVDERRYFMGINPFREETLKQWLLVLTERQRWLERQGIAYWLVVVPNKSSVYPEFMPGIYAGGGSTRLDQLTRFMKKYAPGFPLLDLRPAMLAGKKTRLLYWPTDTHWNNFGSDLAYREIIGCLATRFPSLKALPEDSFETRSCQASARDLEKIIMLPWETPGPLFQLVPKQELPSSLALKSPATEANDWVLYHSNAGVLPLALIIHDSFGEILKPILSVHFKMSRWNYDRSHAFPSSWIEQTHPSLVIEEIVERYLEEDPWSNPQAIK